MDGDQTVVTLVCWGREMGDKKCMRASVYCGEFAWTSSPLTRNELNSYCDLNAFLRVHEK